LGNYVIKDLANSELSSMNVLMSVLYIPDRSGDDHGGCWIKVAPGSWRANLVANALMIGLLVDSCELGLVSSQ
jgi:hypothetical protein